MCDRKVELISVDKLKPIEGHGKKRLKWLLSKILNENVWLSPLLVEKNHNLVLDGHHRLEVARLLGLKKVPVVLFAYDDVKLWSLRKNHVVNRQIVIEKANKGELFPYKTVKHEFPNYEGECSHSLGSLKDA
jgi:hypothetical protein